MARPRVRDAEQTTARPMPKEVNAVELIVVVIVIVVVGLVVWFL